MDSKFRILTQIFGSERIKLNEPLSSHTYSKFGGPAEVFFVATNEREMIKILSLALELDINLFILGSGTKVLISEKGMKGLVVKNRTSDIKISGVKGKVGKSGIGVEEAIVEASSGVTIGKLKDFLIKQGLEDISAYSSLHSTIGGSLRIDNSLLDRVQKIKIWDQGEIKDIDPSSLRREHIILVTFFKFKSK